MNTRTFMESAFVLLGSLAIGVVFSLTEVNDHSFGRWMPITLGTGLFAATATWFGAESRRKADSRPAAAPSGFKRFSYVAILGFLWPTIALSVVAVLKADTMLALFGLGLGVILAGGIAAQWKLRRSEFERYGWRW